MSKNRKKFDNLRLSYNIPQLGKIDAFLCADFSVACYNYLKSENYINRLKEVSQLGIIKNTGYGTHHTRWEYVMLQLYLINQFQDLGNKLKNRVDKNNYRLEHLSANVSGFSSNAEISGASLLQIWVLLFNAGHLQGTFASERGVFKAILENESLYNVFRNGIPSCLKENFDDSLKKYKINNLHKFFISFLLNKEIRNKNSVLKNNIGDIDLINVLLESIKLYFMKDNEKINNLKFIFNKIRQISYLFLDSKYASIPLTFNISPIVINPEYYFNELIVEDSPLNRTLDSFDMLLSYTLYYSDNPIRELGLHSKNIFNRYQEKHFTISLFKKEFGQLHKYFDPQLLDKLNYDSLHLILEHPNFIFSDMIFNYINMSIEKEWNEKIGEKNSVLTVQTDFKKNFTIINLNFIGGSRYNHVLAASRLMKILINVKNNILIEYKIEDSKTRIFEDFIDSIFNNAFEKLFIFILNNSIEKNLFCEFDKKRYHFNVIDIFKKEEINKKFSLISIDNLDKSDQNELLVNKTFLNDNIKRSSSLLSISSIRIFSKIDKKVVSELDGCFLIFKKEKLHIHLIEAKKKKSKSSSYSKKALLKTKEILNINSEEEDFEKIKYGLCYKLILKE